MMYRCNVRRDLTVLQLLGRVAYSSSYGRTDSKKPCKIGYNSDSFDFVRIIKNELLLLLLSKPARLGSTSRATLLVAFSLTGKAILGLLLLLNFLIFSLVRFQSFCKRVVSATA